MFIVFFAISIVVFVVAVMHAFLCTLIGSISFIQQIYLVCFWEAVKGLEGGRGYMIKIYIFRWVVSSFLHLKFCCNSCHELVEVNKLSHLFIINKIRNIFRCIGNKNAHFDTVGLSGYYKFDWIFLSRGAEMI